ncbi:MAG: biotin--[acetyl-CoA-carboxylase] ligase [Acidimicrobiales bacterium]
MVPDMLDRIFNRAARAVMAAGTNTERDEPAYRTYQAVGHEVRWFTEIESTNDYLAGELKCGDGRGSAGASSAVGIGLVTVSDYQTGGRGRLGRRWEAPAGRCLLASVAVRAKSTSERMYLITAMAGLAAVGACKDVARLDVDLAWPNDLYVGGRKLAGILSEAVMLPPAAAYNHKSIVQRYVDSLYTRSDADDELIARTAPRDAGSRQPASTACLVVGIGLNVSWPSTPVDGEMTGSSHNTATSLLMETGRLVDRRVLLERFLLRLDGYSALLATDKGSGDIAQEYRDHCSTLGKLVTVSLMTGGVLAGTAVDVDEQGQLVVENEGGRAAVSAGDVRVVR